MIEGTIHALRCHLRAAAIMFHPFHHPCHFRRGELAIDAHLEHTFMKKTLVLSHQGFPL